MTNFNYEKYSYRYPSRQSLKYGKNGMVASSNPIASQVGITVLQNGGNAIDATVATAAALAIMEPVSNGIGTDNQAIIWFDGEMHGLNSTGYAPSKISREELEKKAPHMDNVGWDPVTVPGTPAGWASMVEKFGNFTLAENLEPAAKLAEEGFPLQTTVAEVWRNNYPKYKAANEKYPEATQHFMDTYYPNGETPEPGQIFKNQDQADTLREIGETNAASFYTGAIADDIVKFSDETGGYFTKEDFENYEPEWLDPMSVNYRGYDIYELPPNCNGIVALEALKILENFDTEILRDKDSIDSHHYQIESIKKAYEDALKHVGDPRFNDIDYNQFIDEEYTRKKAAEITDKATLPEPGTALKGGTVYFNVVDKDGNMVSMIQSNCLGFGAGVLIPERGMFMHCRGTHFDVEEGHPNTIEPGKRPFHTIIPSFISKDGKPIGPVGCMGSFLQPQAHVQIYSAIIDSHLNPQEALDAPRWQWKKDNLIEVEPHMPYNTIRGLEERGHVISQATTYNFFGRGQIIFRQENGVYVGATDGRTDGSIASY